MQLIFFVCLCLCIAAVPCAISVISYGFFVMQDMNFEERDSSMLQGSLKNEFVHEHNTCPTTGCSAKNFTSDQCSLTEPVDSNTSQSEFDEEDLEFADQQRSYYPLKNGLYTKRWWKCECSLCQEVDSWDLEDQYYCDLECWFEEHCFAGLHKVSWPTSGSTLTQTRWDVRERYLCLDA